MATREKPARQRWPRTAKTKSIKNLTSKQERMTHRKCASGLGSNHNLAPCFLFYSWKDNQLGGGCELTTLRCLLSLSVLCWLTQEPVSPQLIYVPVDTTSSSMIPLLEPPFIGWDETDDAFKMCFFFCFKGDRKTLEGFETEKKKKLEQSNTWFQQITLAFSW